MRRRADRRRRARSRSPLPHSSPATARALAAAVVLLLAAGCARATTELRASPPAATARSVVNTDEVRRSIEDERALAANSDHLPREGEAWFAVLDGCTEVLVTAPHATKPTREGQLRFADGGTGALAMAIHRLTDARAIYTTMASPSDPNYYDDNGFKAAVADAVSTRKPVVVLDLHASAPSRPYDIDFGTMGHASLRGREDVLAALADALRREGMTRQSQDFFAAARNQTVTKWVSAHGAPAIQLEINANWLDPGAGPSKAGRYAQLLQGIVRFVESMGCAKDEPTRAGRP